MKREEHYCDVCGKQITALHSDGYQYQTGIILAIDKHIQASLSKKHSCGTSSKAEWLYGIEFCSTECFEKSVDAWVAKVKEFLK